MICNLQKTLDIICTKFGMLADFQLIMTGNLANANLIEAYCDYKKPEVCLIVPSLIEHSPSQWKQFICEIKKHLSAFD